MKALKTTDRTPLPAVRPIVPSRSGLRRLRGILAGFGWLGRLVLVRFVVKIEVRGREHLAGGPKFVVMNHSSPFDPLLLTFYGGVPIHLLVTEPYLADRPVARLIAWLGQIPKRKLDTDTRSIRTMKQWCDVGGVVGTFPEGQFSWDGSPLPLQPGLAQLVRYLDVPVVTVRLTNGDRLWPAWARHPRRTSLRLEFDPPRRFTPEDDIEATIAEKIRVDPERADRFPARGKNLAEGLASFLRFCFECGADGGLRDEGDTIRCDLCGKAWTVSAENRLRERTGGGIETTVAEAWRRVKARLKTEWKDSPKLRSRADVTVYDSTKAQWTEVASAPLALAAGRLTVGEWSLDLGDLLADTMDWGDLILLRTERKRYALRMAEDSRAIWTYALEEVTKKNPHAV